MAARAELQALREQENQLVADVPEIMVMEEMPTPRPAHLLARGAYDAPGDVVPRDTPREPAAVPEGSAAQSPRPGALADRAATIRWPRASSSTASGACTSAAASSRRQEDFGSQGKLPTHPELLDWLAARFMDDGWDVKALHRLIVSSATFRQSSHARRATRRCATRTTCCSSRGPKTRLTAEEIRDSALAASGLLVRTIGGPSVKPYQPAGLWEQSGTGKTYVQDTGRRALSPQPLHVLEADVAAAVDDHLRRRLARSLHRPARPRRRRCRRSCC